jgi:hypothetical protein
MNKGLLILLGGVGLYLWSRQSQAVPAGIIAGPAPGAGGPAPMPTPTPTPTTAQTQIQPGPVAVAPTALSSLKAGLMNYIRTQAGVSDTYIMGMQSPDTWNWLLTQWKPGYTAPSPEDLYPASNDAHKPVLFNDWWDRMVPFLQTAGMSGVRQRQQMPRMQLYGGWGA